MENTPYIGKTCAFCKAKFVEGDSITVCGACGIPHHTDCWVENKGCSTFGCSGQGRGRGVSGSARSDVCPSCGAVLKEDFQFCQNCGSPRGIVSKNICTSCGYPLGEDDEFCSQCGGRTGTGGLAAPTYAPAPVQPPLPVYAQVSQPYAPAAPAYPPVLQYQGGQYPAPLYQTGAPYPPAYPPAPQYSGGQYPAPQYQVGSPYPPAAQYQGGQYPYGYADPLAKASDLWAWLLVFVPLVVDFILYSVTKIITTWIILVVIRMVFSLLDNKELHKYGTPPDSWIWFGIFLPPVYLFLRAAKVGRRYAYAIVWCVIFGSYFLLLFFALLAIS